MTGGLSAAGMARAYASGRKWKRVLAAKITSGGLAPEESSGRALAGVFPISPTELGTHATPPDVSHRAPDVVGRVPPRGGSPGQGTGPKTRDRCGFIRVLPAPAGITSQQIISQAPSLAEYGMKTGLLSVRKMSDADKEFVRAILEKPECLKVSPEERRESQRLCTARRRAEQRGQDISQFPSRVRSRRARRIYQRRGWIRKFILDRAEKVDQFVFQDICEICPIIPEATARRMCIYLFKAGLLECVRPGRNGADPRPAIYRLKR